VASRSGDENGLLAANGVTGLIRTHREAGKLKDVSYGVLRVDLVFTLRVPGSESRSGDGSAQRSEMAQRDDDDDFATVEQQHLGIENPRARVGCCIHPLSMLAS